jgi:hypothetical protein
MEIGPHKGEFRFDDPQSTQLDELVVVIASNTITHPPDTQSIFLGLRTEAGVSTRVGVGWVYYDVREDHMVLPPWQYRFLKLA